MGSSDVKTLVFGCDQVAAASLWRQLIGHGRKIALIADEEDLLQRLPSIANPLIILVGCENFIDFVAKLRSLHGGEVFIICVVRDVADEGVFEGYHQGADIVLQLNEDSASQILRLLPS